MTRELGKKTNKYKQKIGDGVKTSYVVNHNLGSRDVVAQLRQSGSPFEVVYTDIELTTENSATISFANAPKLEEYVVTVIG